MVCLHHGMYCTACALTFGDGEARCPRCLKTSTVVASAPVANLPAVPKLLIAGVVVWAVGLFSLTSASKGHDIASRTERGTLGVVALTGFLLTVIGGIRYWRARRRAVTASGKNP